MEYDCEMFDDSEAALDALLGKAQWEEPTEAMTQRLAALIQSSVAVEESPAEEPLIVTRASGPCEMIESLPASSVVIHEEHGPEARVTDAPLVIPSVSDRPLVVPPKPRRWLGEFAAMAASVVILIGVGALLVHLMPSPSIVKGNVVSLPGRAPTPMELWLISPAGQKYIAGRSNPAMAKVDPHLVKIQNLCRGGDSTELIFAMLHESDPESQTQLLSALFDRRDGVQRFLDLVRNRQTRDKAIALLQTLPSPPTESLMAQLDSSSVERRFAAAKALGSLCNGRDLSTLKRMIESNNHQREALAVLSQCRDPKAAKYMQELRRTPALSSQLDVVKNEMQQLF